MKKQCKNAACPSVWTLFSALAAVLCLLAQGCASAPKETEAGLSVPGNPVAESVSTNAVPAAALAPENAAPEEPSPENVPPPPPKPKPWSTAYSADRVKVLIDGVTVYLGKPSRSDWRSKKVSPSAMDQRFTVSPLLHARKTPVVTNRAIRICLDPGHGGKDSGALSKDRRTQESALTLDLAKRVQAHLKADGFEVLLTRRNDSTTQTLFDRPTKAYQWRADAFVSIHINSNPSAAASGYETYLLPARGMESTGYEGKGPSQSSELIYAGNASDTQNMQLAYCIQRRLLRATASKKDRGVRRARFAVLREARMPAALVECGFISNAKDLSFLRTESGREKIARGIYEGIADWAYGTMEPGLPPHKSGARGQRNPARAPAVEKPAATYAEQVKASVLPVPDAAQIPKFTAPADPAPWTPPQVDEDPQRAALRAAAEKAAGILPHSSVSPKIKP